MNFEQDRKSLYERRKNLLYLVHQYLSELGLQKSATVLQQEVDLSEDFQVCDNVDLETIYMDYCSYYKLKFGKNPKIVKRAETSGVTCRPRTVGDTEKVREKIKRMSVSTMNLAADSVVVGHSFQSLPSVPSMSSFIKNEPMNITIKPVLSAFEDWTPEWREMAQMVCRDLIQKDYGITFKKVYGSETAKSILYESVVLPLEFPELFADGIKSWRSVLIHGPPGCGKTLLAKALCSELKGKFAFFNVASSTVVSKWRGESEKLIRVLFEVAKFYAPSIIFIDEIDGLTSLRDCNTDHEATKRFKNEFLTLIDGIGSEDVQGGVFLLANTNLPWEIDPAFLRRFERKILIELPDAQARIDIFVSCLPIIREQQEINLNELAQATNFFTGDEIRIACKEATMMMIRCNIQRTKGLSIAPVNPFLR